MPRRVKDAAPSADRRAVLRAARRSGLRLGRLVPVLSLALGLAGAGLLAAQASPVHPRFEREVLPGAPGPNRLEPDLGLLAGATPNLADLRLYDTADREVPYLLLRPFRQEPEWREGRLLRIAATRPTSGFEVDLGALAAVDRLRLDGIPSPFLKRFQLEGGGDRTRWTVLVHMGTLFDLPDQGLRATEIAFPAGEYRYFRLTWDDRNSAVVAFPAEVSARLARAADPLAALRVPVEFTQRASEPGKSRFHLRLPGPALPVVALELKVEGGNLLRAATVTQGRLGNGEVTPVRVGGGTLRRAVRDGVVAADLRLPVANLEGSELDLTVEDGDNPPFLLIEVRAELAPLPWIYFEAPDARLLTARFGDPRATAPRYDLEAVRDGLAKVHPAWARWGEPGSHPITGQASVTATQEGKGALPTLGAPVDVAGFGDRRKVPAPEGGSAAVPALDGAGGAVLSSLLLDAAVLAGSPGLSDLRLADAKGRQIPYLVDRRSEPLALDLPALSPVSPRKGEAGVSRYRLELPYATLPEARLVLKTDIWVFERQVRLVRLPPERPADRRPGSEREVTVAEATWRHADPETAAPSLVLAVPADGAGRWEVRIDDGDNAPLTLQPPQLLLPAVRLRFFHPGGEIQLLYGNSSLAPPRYDLELLGPQLLGAAAQEITLEPEGKGRTETDDSRKEALPRYAFWGVIGLAVLVLLVVLARLLREKGEG